MSSGELLGLVLICLFTAGCGLVAAEEAATPTATSTIPATTPTPTQAQPTATIAPPTATLVPTASSLSPSQPITITAITMLDTNLGWGIGDTGEGVDHVLQTTDGGRTWRDLSPAEALSEGTPLTQALGYFQSPERAWVTYYGPEVVTSEASPVVWHTMDGGRSWQASQPLDRSGLEEIFDPSHLQFIDEDTGWLLVHVGVGMSHDYVAYYKSTDGGQTFKRILDPYNDGGIQACYKNDMLFTGTQHGWLTGTCNGVAAGVLLFQTAEGGLTWQTVTLPAPADSPDLFTRFDVACGSNWPVFVDKQTGYIAVACDLYDQEPRTTVDYLYFTQDGGETWKSTSYPGGELRFFDAQTGLALGKETYKTKDAGAIWTKISVVSWEGSFDFPDEDHAWAVARSEDQLALVFSGDGGQYWSILEPVLVP